MATQTVNEAVDQDDPLNLHQVYRAQTECGYSHDLLLYKNQAQAMAARLRGIAAISAVLIAEGTELDLGEWMRPGLIEAIHSLTEDAQCALEEINTRAEKMAGGMA